MKAIARSEKRLFLFIFPLLALLVSLIITPPVVYLIDDAGENKQITSSAPEQSELSKKYSFYSVTVAEIQMRTKITSDQADEVFRILVSCGLDKRIGRLYVVSAEEHIYRFYLNDDVCLLYLRDGAVSSVKRDSVDIYPKSAPTPNDRLSGAGNTVVYNNPEQQETTGYVLNTSTQKYHRPTCGYVSRIKSSNYATVESEDSFLLNGYDACLKCKP